MPTGAQKSAPLSQRMKNDNKLLNSNHPPPGKNTQKTVAPAKAKRLD